MCLRRRGVPGGPDEALGGILILPSYARKSAVGRGVRVLVLEPDGMSSRLLNLPTNPRNSLQGVYQTHRSSPLQNPPPIVGGPAIDHPPSLVIAQVPLKPRSRHLETLTPGTS